MKTKVHYYLANIQEDEDGYSLYSNNSIISKNSKKGKGIKTTYPTNTISGIENPKFSSQTSSISETEIRNEKE